jgi:hypothetical protein
VIENDRPRRSVTHGDDEKLETLTAPNPRPLFVQRIGDIVISQCSNAPRRLVHNRPTSKPTQAPSMILPATPL